jgi:hypothetical protein
MKVSEMRNLCLKLIDNRIKSAQHVQNEPALHNLYTLRAEIERKAVKMMTSLMDEGRGFFDSATFVTEAYRDLADICDAYHVPGVVTDDRE